MASISKKQFQRLIDKHQHYINEDTDNWRSCKAVVSDKMVGEMVIEDENLSHSVFEYTSFEDTTFIDVDFSNGWFSTCEFDGCRFIGCVFDGAFFNDDAFEECVFTGSKFYSCTFNDCAVRRSTTMSDEFAKDLDVNPTKYCPINISNSRFYLCDFTNAFVEQTDFIKNDLDSCRFYTCNFGHLSTYEHFGPRRAADNRSHFRYCMFGASCENIPDLPMACPSTGSFVAYKKVKVLYEGGRIISNIGNYAIAVLQIPASAKRLSANGTKCRCNKAKVLRFETLDGEKIDNIKDYTFTSIHDPYFDYVVGKTVKPVLPFCEDRWSECAAGIHFFMNREDAVQY